MSINYQTVKRLKLLLFTVLFVIFSLNCAWAADPAWKDYANYNSFTSTGIAGGIAKKHDTLTITFSIVDPGTGTDNAALQASRRDLVANGSRLHVEFYSSSTENASTKVFEMNDIGVDRNGWAYRYTHIFPEGTTNYKESNFCHVNCWLYDKDGSTSTKVLGPYSIIQNFILDDCPPKPTFKVASNRDGTGNPLTGDYLTNETGTGAGKKFAFVITDSKYQSNPTPGTQCWINLTNLGGVETEILPSSTPTTTANFATALFSTTDFAERDSDNGAIDITYRIKDQINAEVTGKYQLKFDNKPPRPVEKDGGVGYFGTGEKFTGFVSTSGIISRDEIVKVRATANACGQGDSVSFTLKVQKKNPDTGENIGTPIDLPGFGSKNMTVPGGVVKNSTNSWEYSVTDTSFINNGDEGYFGSLIAEFSFNDLAGNKVTKTKKIDIDTRKKDIIAKLVGEDKTSDITSINRNTLFYVKMTFSSWKPSADNGKVTVDLSSIGLGATTALTPNNAERSEYLSASIDPSTLGEKDITTTFKYKVEDKGLDKPKEDNVSPINIVFDNIVPKINDTGTKIALSGGDTFLLHDKEFNVLGQIDNFDGERPDTGGEAKVYFYYKKDGKGAGEEIANYDLTLVGANNPPPNTTANWKNLITGDAEFAKFNGKNGTFYAKFRFKDNAGNISEKITDEIGISSEELNLQAKIYANVNGTPDTPPFAAMTNGDSVNLKESFYLQITFSGWTPAEKGTITVDLSELGLGNNVKLNKESASVYKSDTYAANAINPPKDGKFQLKYVITDESLPGGTYNGNFDPLVFWFDNIPPKPVDGTAGGEDGTRFVSADNIITDGEQVILQAQVTEHCIGDKVKVKLTYASEDGAVTGTLVNNEDMTIKGDETAGAVVTWLNDYTNKLTDDMKKKKGNLKAVFTFYDAVGNTVTKERTIEIDYRQVIVIGRVIDESTSALLNPSIINRKTRFLLTVFFGDGSADKFFPSSNAEITVDLSSISDEELKPIKLIRNEENKTYSSGPMDPVNFSIGGKGIEKSVSFKFTISGDNTIGDTKKDEIFQPLPIWFDNMNPEPNTATPGTEGTGFVVAEGKTKLIRGDMISLRAESKRYLEEDYVSVLVEFLDGNTGNVVANKTVSNMTLIESTDGGKAVWTTSFDPKSAGFYGLEGTLRAIFTFKDRAGNSVEVQRTFPAYFKEPEFNHAKTRVYLCDDGGNKSEETSYKTPLVATTSCYLSFEVELKEIPTDGVEVSVDLSPIGKVDPLKLSQTVGTVFKGDYQIPAGTIDDKSEEYKFTVTAATTIDGTKIASSTYTDPGVTIDNQKPVIEGTITVTNTTSGKIIDKSHPENYKIGETYEIRTTIRNLEPNGRVFVDLSSLCVGSDTVELTNLYGDVYTYEGLIINNRDAEVVCDATETFQLMAYDTVRQNGEDIYPAHYVYGDTEPKKYDNEPPIITGVTYTAVNSKGVPKNADEWIQIGDKVTVYIDVASTTSWAPYVYDSQIIRLTNQDRYGIANSDFNVTDGQYKLTFEVPEVELSKDLSYNNYTATFTYDCYDNDYNYSVDEDYVATNTFYIFKFDQVRPAPSHITFSTTTEHGIPSVINKDDKLTFHVAIGGEVNDVATVTVDVGDYTGTPGEVLVLKDDDGDRVWEASLDAIPGIASKRIQFKATVTDNAGNSTTKADMKWYTLDTIAPAFTSNYIKITKTNNDNPVNNVANINDEIAVYLTMEKFEVGDLASVTLYFGDTHIATASVVCKNQVDGVASFTVKRSGIDKWPDLDGTDDAFLTYVLTSRDIHGNNGDPIVAQSNANDVAHEDFNFVVKNTLPKVKEEETRFELNPNNELKQLVGTEAVPVFNIGDGLFVRAALDSDTAIHSAWVDFSPIGGRSIATCTLNDLSEIYIASNTAAFDFLGGYGITRDMATFTFRINMKDKGGKIASTTRKIIIDTKRPEITHIDFEGTRFLITTNEDLNPDESTLVVDGWVVKNSDGSEITLIPEKVSYKRVSAKTITVQLNDAARGEFSAWDASGNVTLSIPAESFQDFCHNTNSAIANSPVTVSENQWREDVRFESITLEKSFGSVYNAANETTNDPMVMTFKFTKNMSFDALTTVTPSASSDHSHLAIVSSKSGVSESGLQGDPSFNYFYVFQSDDKFEEVDSRTLTVTFGKNGSAWLARMLSESGASLKVCHRYNTDVKRFGYDEFSLPMEHYPLSKAFAITDNHADWNNLARAINVSGPKSGKPLLNFSDKTLTIEFSEPVLLYNDAFPNNLATPYVLSLPTTKNNPVSDYKNKIKLCYDNSNLSTSYQLEFDAMPNTNEYASTTVKLKLSSKDIKNVLDMYDKYDYAPSWGIRLDEGAFKTIYSINCRPYANFIDPVAGVAESEGELQYEKVNILAAAAVSDKPPIKEDKGNLKVDFELIPSKITEIDVRIPFDKSVIPEAKLYRISGGVETLVANGTYTNWTTRTINGITRNVVSYSFNDDFLVAPFDLASGALKLSGLRNIFAYEYVTQVATYVYGISDKNSSALGFSVASQPLTLDTKKPEFVSFSHEDIGLGICEKSKGEYTVKFQEAVDTSINPKFYISTGTQSLYFEFKKWEREGIASGSNVAYFTNPFAITSTLPNGDWSYHVLNVKDMAENFMEEKIGTVQVRSHIPSIKSVHSYTKQSNVNPEHYIADMPFNYGVIEEGKVYVNIEFQTAPENPPNKLRFYNAAGTKVGNEVPLVATADEMLATATITAAELPVAVLEASNVINLRLVDKAGNESGNLARNLVYDNSAPVVSALEFDSTSIATYTDIVTAPEKTYYAGPKTLPVIATLANTDVIHVLVETDGGDVVATYTVTGIGTNKYTASLAPLHAGDYIVMVYDEAGNVADRAISLHIDETKPVVNSIEIETAAPAPITVIGQIAKESMNFIVEFDESINPQITPQLTLATTSATISMNFVEWRDNYQTAVYTNSNAVISTMPAGYYYYNVGNAYDLAGNIIDPLSDDDAFKLSVQTNGPVANASIVSYQGYGIEEVVNRPVNMGRVSPTNPVGIVLTYAGTRVNTPHELEVVDSAGNHIASYVPEEIVENMSIATITSNVGFENGKTYKFRLVDNLGNIGTFLTQTLAVDNDAPIVNSYSFDNGIGSFTNNLYYFNSGSVESGAATFVLEAEDTLTWLASGTDPVVATFSGNLSSSAMTHDLRWPSKNLADGEYGIIFLDAAGNAATKSGRMATMKVVVDTVAPTVIDAYLSNVDGIRSLNTYLGYTQAASATFTVEFSESMHSGYTPTVYMHNDTDSTNIPLNFVKWIDNFTKAIYVNKEEIGDKIAPAEYGFNVDNAKDLAGNAIASTEPDSGNTVLIVSQRPKFDVALTSRQTDIYGNNDLTNYPFNFGVAPGVATITVRYASGHPVASSLPHKLLVYDGNSATSANIATLTVDEGKVTIDADSFGAAPTSKNYYFKIIDSYDSVSEFADTPIVLDMESPEISSFGLNKEYYNPTKAASLLVNARRSDGDTDGLALAFVKADDGTIAHVRDDFQATGGNFEIKREWSTRLEDGDYQFAVYDKAGNEAALPGTMPTLHVDRLAPSVLEVVSYPDPISAGAAGLATITVKFNEAINNGMGNLALSLATTTQTVSIPCSFTGFEDAEHTIASFSVGAVTNSIPQGWYDCVVSNARDMTENVMAASSVGKVKILSRGPDITSINFVSTQKTVAASPTERVKNTPYSFNVADGNLVINAVFRKAPASSGKTYKLNIYSPNGSLSQAVLAYEVDNPIATYVWNYADPPTGAVPVSGNYTVYVSDESGESLESAVWVVDNDAPVYTAGTLQFAGVQDADNSTVYYNSAIFPDAAVQLNATDNSSVKLRLTGPASAAAPATDTYNLASNGSVKTMTFDGKNNRSTDEVKMPLADGEYAIALADAAGNLAVCPAPAVDAANENTIYKLVIDSTAPVVAGYNMYFEKGGVYTSITNGGDFSPRGGILLVKANIADAALAKTSSWFVEIYRKDNGQVYKKLLLENHEGTGDALKWGVYWDGKDSAGNYVPENNYAIRITDFVGNRAVNAGGDAMFAEIMVITSEFKALEARQITSNSLEVFFNHSLTTGTVNFAYGKLNDSGNVTGWTAISGSVNEADETHGKRLVATATANFESGNYRLNFTGVTNKYGAELADAYANFATDGDGPKVIGYTYNGLPYGAADCVIITFDQAVEIESAKVPANYTVKNAIGGAVLTINSVNLISADSVSLYFASVLVEGTAYTVVAPGVKDEIGNLGKDEALRFLGRDITAPTINIAMFSNPMNLRDLIVIATTNERLLSVPVVEISAGTRVENRNMQTHPSNNMAYVMSYSVPSKVSANYFFAAVATDTSGISGRSSSAQFTVANIRANVVSEQTNEAGNLKLNFKEDSFKNDTQVKVLEHEITVNASGTIELRGSAREFLQSLRGSAVTELATPTEVVGSELLPLSKAYEVTVNGSDVNNGFDVSITPEVATASVGMGMFYQSGDKWNLVTAYRSNDNSYKASLKSTTTLALMRDTKAPTITLDDSMDFTKEFDSGRPEFKGKVEDFGAGVDTSSLEVVFDDMVSQSFALNDDGEFCFKPINELTGGVHTVEFKVGDRTGNKATSGSMRFNVVNELKVTQIIQWPNPAKNYMNIRFKTNRADITEENVKIRIFDVAGHRVRNLVVAPRRTGGVYDFKWDMLNGKGKRVANGVYFAKVEIRDPNNPSIKFKATLKLAVLR